MADQIKIQDDWTAPGSEDTEFDVLMEPGADRPVRKR